MHPECGRIDGWLRGGFASLGDAQTPFVNISEGKLESSPPQSASVFLESPIAAIPRGVPTLTVTPLVANAAKSRVRTVRYDGV